MSNSETNNLIEGRFQVYQANCIGELESFENSVFSSEFNKPVKMSVYCVYENKIKYYKTQKIGVDKFILIEDGEWTYG